MTVTTTAKTASPGESPPCCSVRLFVFAVTVFLLRDAGKLTSAHILSTMGVVINLLSNPGFIVRVTIEYMKTKPFYNATLAAGYIVGLVYFVFTFIAQPNTPDSQQPFLLIPIAILSLFVLSAAVMGYLFLYEPLMLYFDNKRQEAVRFFLTTVGIFALITFAFLALLIVFR